MGVPIAGLGSSFANTGATSGTRSGTQTGTQIGNTTGSSTQTTSTPFNPWSLAPLAFLPMTGGGSLGGGILGSLGGGLFNSLSNGFMGPGSFNRGSNAIVIAGHSAS